MLTNLKNALDSTGYKFAHFGWTSEGISNDHGVYAEDSEISLFAGNKHAETAIQGTVDYFTRDDSGTPKTKIETALDSINIAWYLNSIQYEEDTGFIHYEWVFTDLSD